MQLHHGVLSRRTHGCSLYLLKMRFCNQHLLTFSHDYSSTGTPGNAGSAIKKEVKKIINEDEQEIRSSPSINKSSTKSNVVLYKSHSSKSFFPRALLSLSTIHTGYWIWYVCDFTPFVQEQALSSAANAAAVGTTESAVDITTSISSIDNTVGYVGLGLAIFMSAASLIYPTSLVQEIQLVTQPDTKTTTTTTTPGTLSSSSSPTLQIRTYSLPFITPSPKTINYKLGDLLIDSPTDVKEIITKYRGDISQYDGYLPLHAEGRYINLLLQLSDQGKNKKDVDSDRNGNEIYDSAILFKSLVSPKLHAVLSSGDQYESELNDSNIDNRHKRSSQISLKKQKRKERQLLRRR